MTINGDILINPILPRQREYSVILPEIKIDWCLSTSLFWNQNQTINNFMKNETELVLNGLTMLDEKEHVKIKEYIHKYISFIVDYIKV